MYNKVKFVETNHDANKYSVLGIMSMGAVRIHLGQITSVLLNLC